METTVSNQQVRQEVSKTKITLDKLSKSDTQKPGTMTAQIRQTVTTTSYYPSKKTTSDMQSGLFGNKEFGFDEQVFTSEEVRVAWILVPENIKEEEVKARLEKANEAGSTIYKVLSNEPILDDNQKYAISAGLRTLDQYADAQVVRYPANHPTSPNALILDANGNPQYRRTFFWNAPIKDVDARDANKVYASPAIKAELQGASVMQGQTI